MILRPYQQQAVDSALDAIDRGVLGIAMQLATGAGKTLVLAEIAKHLMQGGRVLAMAHREELVNQLAATFKRHIGCRVGIERAGQHATWDEPIIVASVPTLGCNKGKRLQGIDPLEFTAIITDEVHRQATSCSTYMEVLKWAGIAKDRKPTGQGPTLIGCTATLRRNDKQALAPWMQEVVADVPLRWLIDKGYLTPFRCVQLRSGINLDEVKCRAGEFVESDLERTLNIDGRNLLAIAHYRTHASDRQFIAFATGVQHAHTLASQFRAAGYKVEAVDGTTKPEVRRDLLNRYRRGELHGLTSVGVLSEGTDLPMTQALYMLRPTKSPLIYSQQVGRGSRLWSADAQNADPHNEFWHGAKLGLRSTKEDCMIVDMTDNTSKHTLVHAPSLVGRAFSEKEEAVKSPKEPPVQPARFESVAVDLAEIEQQIQWVDPWENGDSFPDLYKWSKSEQGWALMLPGCWARITQADGQWIASFQGISQPPTRHANALSAFSHVDEVVMGLYGQRAKRVEPSPSRAREVQRMTRPLRDLCTELPAPYQGRLMKLLEYVTRQELAREGERIAA